MTQDIKTPFLKLLALILSIPLLIFGSQYFIIWATWDFSGDFLRADQCLDGGGVWDRAVEEGKCWYAGECEDLDGYWLAAESRCVTEPKDDVL